MESKVENSIEQNNKYRVRCHELEDENSALNCEIEKEKIRNEKLKKDLLDVFKELDTVGIIHGAGSKARAKEKLIEAMKTRYGDKYWNKVIIKDEPTTDQPAGPAEQPAEAEPATE